MFLVLTAHTASGELVKNSKVLWVVLGIGGVCAVCSVMTIGLMALGLIAGDASTTPTAQQLLPRGETPNEFPGSVGWLPSGRGVELPAPSVDDSGPRGLWWTFQGNDALPMIFLADGTRATHPRLGGGSLFDVAGQRGQRGSTGVGTFQIADGSITQQHDGFTSTDPFTFGDDASGAYFGVGATRFRPLTPPTEDWLFGRWKTAGGEYVFARDGSCTLGQNTAVAVGGGGCRWRLEGHLLEVQPNGARGWISFIGASSDSLLIIGTSVYSRQ